MVEIVQAGRAAAAPPSDLEHRARSGDADAQVRLAARLDAEGRPEEAVDWLARAGRQGHVGALTRLGMRLMTGAGAPYLPAQGAGLLLGALEKGGAEAAAKLALMAGVGLHCGQSWDVALDLLQRAAELGWPGARAELAVLSADRALAAQAGAGQGACDDIWGRLRRAVDVAAWTAAPPAEVLSADPLVRRFRDFAAPDACDWLIDQARGRLVRAQVYDSASGAAAEDDYRNNSVANFGLFDTSLVLLLLQARIASAIGVPVARMEAANVLHYATGEKFDEHFDYIDPRSPSYERLVARGGQRVATCVLYLNDDYEGGETEFTRLGLSNKGVRGDAVVFLSVLPDGTPDPRSAHAGRPPTRGEKWIVVNFVRDKPQLPVA